MCGKGPANPVHTPKYTPLLPTAQSRDHALMIPRTRPWSAGHPVGRPGDGHCGSLGPLRAAAPAERRGDCAGAPLAFREASVPTRAKPLFFSHTKPPDWLPAPAPAPPPVKQPPPPPPFPQTVPWLRVASRRPLSGPQARFHRHSSPGLRAPRRSGARCGGRARGSRTRPGGGLAH